MANRKYSEEFRVEAVKQVAEQGYSVKEVSDRLGVSTKSLYKLLFIMDLIFILIQE